MAFDTSALLSRLRLKAVLDGSETDYTDAVLLDICDQQTADTIAPKIRATNGDYYLTYKDITLTVGRNKYPLPTRASIGRLHSVYLLNAEKTVQSFLYFADQRDLGISTAGTPAYHTLNDNSVVLYSTPSVAGYLRVYFTYSPSQLVLPSACMLVTSRTAGKLNGTPPTSWDTTLKYDIVSGNSPFEIVSSDLIASDLTTGITTTEASFDTARVDDGGTFYVTLAEQTCFPMMPKELHYVLADLASCPVLHNVGDESWAERMSTSQAKVSEIVASMFPRKLTEMKPVYNSKSLLGYFAR